MKHIFLMFAIKVGALILVGFVARRYLERTYGTSDPVMLEEMFRNNFDEES